jgi:ATP phosphoribosyltransferase regulatory subunit
MDVYGMNRCNTLPVFSPREACELKLRALYESRGFLRTEIAKFEDYNLYLDNKNFLGTDRILTFMDHSGRLLALKPDITLSIAKNLPAQVSKASEQLYYMDEVVRFSPENRAYKVLDQIGLEWIGRKDAFANLEVLDLALRSLALMGESAMDLSHLGFVSGLLENTGLSPQVERKVLGAIHAKSPHDVAGILEAEGVANSRKEQILSLAGIHGPFLQALEKAKSLIQGEEMARAYDELEALAKSLHLAEHQTLHLDFSVVNDLDYYNGLIFRGYIRGIPGVVCSGGRYDNLMQKLGKDCCAIGFGIALHQLDHLWGEHNTMVDVLLLYPAVCDWKALMKRVNELNTKGFTVRCEREDADVGGLFYRRLERFEEVG